MEPSVSSTESTKDIVSLLHTCVSHARWRTRIRVPFGGPRGLPKLTYLFFGPLLPTRTGGGRREMILVCGIVVLILLRIILAGRSHSLYLVRDEIGNESLLLDGRVSGTRSLFLVDTAYAGPPVLSLSYLNALRTHGATLSSGTVRRRYAKAMALLSSTTSEDDLHRGYRFLASKGMCKTYTSGCTMRLMGIGETVETHSAMLLCPPVRFHRELLPLGRWDADVLVTNSLQGSVHILTSDYLIHHSPSLISIAKGKLYLRARVSSRKFVFYDAELVGGAFLVPVTVGGMTIKVVVDTGASAPLSLSPSARGAIDASPSERSIRQVGVNGESVCSDVVLSDVEFGGLRLEKTEVMINSQDVEGADGYMGLCILRMFDILITSHTIGFRPNGLPSGKMVSSVGKCSKG